MERCNLLLIIRDSVETLSENWGKFQGSAPFGQLRHDESSAMCDVDAG